MKLTILGGTMVAIAALLAAAPAISRATPFKSRIDSTVEIDASPDIVWSVLTDFHRYPDWNPFFHTVTGSAQVGNRLTVTSRLSGINRNFSFKPKILVVEEGRELRWRGRMVLPGLFNGEHWFVIEQIALGRVRLQHGEAFAGLLMPPMRNNIIAKTRRSFTKMSAALKARAEEFANACAKV